MQYRFWRSFYQRAAEDVNYLYTASWNLSFEFCRFSMTIRRYKKRIANINVTNWSIFVHSESTFKKICLKMTYYFVLIEIMWFICIRGFLFSKEKEKFISNEVFKDMSLVNLKRKHEKKSKKSNISKPKIFVIFYRPSFFRRQ